MANSVGEAADGDVGCANPMANSVGEATDSDVGCANPIATHRFSRGARRDQMVRTVFSGMYDGRIRTIGTSEMEDFISRVGLRGDKMYP